MPKKYRLTEDLRAEVRAYLRLIGWREDRWGNFLHPDRDNERYKVAAHNLKRQRKDPESGRWRNISSAKIRSLRLFSPDFNFDESE